MSIVETRGLSTVSSSGLGKSYTTTLTLSRVKISKNKKHLFLNLRMLNPMIPDSTLFLFPPFPIVSCQIEKHVIRHLGGICIRRNVRFCTPPLISRTRADTALVDSSFDSSRSLDSKNILNADLGPTEKIDFSVPRPTNAPRKFPLSQSCALTFQKRMYFQGGPGSREKVNGLWVGRVDNSGGPKPRSTPRTPRIFIAVWSPERAIPGARTKIVITYSVVEIES